MGTNFAEQVRLTRLVHLIHEEVDRDCVTHWTKEQIRITFPEGYPEEQLRKGRQSCYVGPNDRWLQL